MNANEQPPLNLIEEDLGETWIEDFAAAGIDEAETYLAQVVVDRVDRRAAYEAFNAWLVERGQQADEIDEVAFGAIPAPRSGLARAALRSTLIAQQYEVADDASSYRPASELRGPN